MPVFFLFSSSYWHGNTNAMLQNWSYASFLCMHHILFLNLFNNYFGENHIFVEVFVLSSGSRQEVSVEVFGVFQVLSSLSFPKVHTYQRAWAWKSSDGSNYICSKFHCSKPKIGCLSSITKTWTSFGPFDVQKTKFESIQWIILQI